MSRVYPLEIRLFGTMRVERAGQALVFPGARVRELFSYLVLNRKWSHSREQLAGLFWTERDDAQARHCLNTTLWRLRQALNEPEERSQPYLRVDAHSIRFNESSHFWLDVDEFQHLCVSADQLGTDAQDRQAQLYRQALALYVGGLLPECYDDWCVIERERLERLCLRALAWLLNYDTAAGSYEAAISTGMRMLGFDPLLEEVHRDLIRLMLQSRGPAAALRQYRMCQQCLQRELGIEPMPETQALLGDIMALSTSNAEIQSVLSASETAVDPSAANRSLDLRSLLRSLKAAASVLESTAIQLETLLQADR